MKKIFLITILTISLNAKAQLVRPFIGVSSYLQWDFEKSTFFEANVGTEFKITSYLMPELEFSYFFGTIKEESRYNNQLIQTSFYARSVTSLNFTFCPKIVFGGREAGVGNLVILPSYTFSNIEANEDFMEFDENNILISSNDIQKDSQHSFGLGIGCDIALSNDNSSSICLILCYNGVSLGKVVNELDHSSQYKINDKGVLGFGINYYFGFKKQQKKH